MKITFWKKTTKYAPSQFNWKELNINAKQWLFGDRVKWTSINDYHTKKIFATNAFHEKIFFIVRFKTKFRLQVENEKKMPVSV